MLTRPDAQSVHLVGICGTAMAALAAMLKERGFKVTGSDQGVYPPMSDFLAHQGISIREGYRPENLGHNPDLAVIGNAISRGNPEVEAILDRGIPYRSLPEVLRSWFIEGKKALVVTGTHGKTTTASILAWLLHQAGRDPSYLVGGIPANFSMGYRLGKGDEFVLEGDEYDTAFFDKRPKFLHYLPRIVTLGALEYDHSDIYEDMEALFRAFNLLLRVIPKTGILIIRGGDPNTQRIAEAAPCAVVTCALEDEAADWSANGIQIEDARIHFRVLRNGREVGECTWTLPGRHNVINALLAIAAAHNCDVPVRDSIEALSEFQGVQRRMQWLGEHAGVLIYDDFAHHPTAIRSALGALRELHPDRRIWAVLEPRSNTMCRRFFQEVLPGAFSPADAVVIGAVHRAERIPPRERLDPQAVVETIRQEGKKAWHLHDNSEITGFLMERLEPGDAVCIMSNGGFGGLQQRITRALDGKEEGDLTTKRRAGQ